MPDIDNHTTVNEPEKMIGCEITTLVIKVNPNAMHKSPDEKQILSLGSEDDSDVEIISDIKSEKRWGFSNGNHILKFFSWQLMLIYIDLFIVQYLFIF